VLPVEVRSALRRRVADKTLDEKRVSVILKRFAADRAFWTVIEVSGEVLTTAEVADAPEQQEHAGDEREGPDRGTPIVSALSGPHWNRRGQAHPAPRARKKKRRGDCDEPWQGDECQELRALAQDDCRFRAFLRFARAPYAGTLARGAPGAPGANTARSAPGVVGDLRYDRSPGLDFSDLPLDRAAPCPKRVPPWIPPRSDLFGPLE